MNRRRFVAVIAALCVAAAIILVIITSRGGARDLTVCEARRAADRIAEIEGPGYDKGLESWTSYAGPHVAMIRRTPDFSS
ncbi:MAG: hypothetical protein WKF45_07245 [Ilumatobacteraceae bacterium]